MYVYARGRGGVCLGWTREGGWRAELIYVMVVRAAAKGAVVVRNRNVAAARSENFCNDIEIFKNKSLLIECNVVPST